MPTKKDPLNVSDAALLLKIGPRAVRQAIQRGRIPAEKWGRDYQIARAEVLRYKSERHAGGRPRLVEPESNLELAQANREGVA